jgi:hypothetical protein
MPYRISSKGLVTVKADTLLQLWEEIDKCIENEKLESLSFRFNQHVSNYDTGANVQLLPWYTNGKWHAQLMANDHGKP